MKQKIILGVALLLLITVICLTMFEIASIVSGKKIWILPKPVGEGMTMDEVVSLLGDGYNDIGSGLPIYNWDTTLGDVTITFMLNENFEFAVTSIVPSLSYLCVLIIAFLVCLSIFLILFCFLLKKFRAMRKTDLNT